VALLGQRDAEQVPVEGDQTLRLGRDDPGEEPEIFWPPGGHRAARPAPRIGMSTSIRSSRR
jgi:hypothetical protein